MAEKPVLEQIIEKFSSESQFVREEAAYELSLINSEKAIKVFVNGLSDSVPGIRAACAKFISKYGSQYSALAVGPLIKALHDADAETARNAARSLGSIGDNSAVDPLIEILKNENQNTRIYAIIALGKLGDDRAVRPMLELMRDDHDKKVRATILMALGNFKNPKLLPIIMKFGLADNDARVRASAVESISNLNPTLEEVSGELRKMLHDPHNRVVANACMALWKAGDLSVTDDITKLIKNQDKTFRASGAYVLGNIINSEALSMLISMKNDPDADVRVNVARSLSRVSSPKALAELIEMLEDKDEAVKKTAYNFILKCGEEYAFWPMINNLKSSRELMRFIAVKVLCNIDDPAAIPYISEAVQNEKPSEMKNEMSKFLAIMNERHPEGAKKIERHKEEPRIIVQTQNFNESNALPEVSEEKTLADKIIEQLFHKSQFLREEAAYELSFIHSEKAVIALVKGLSDPVARVRCICARSLSKYGWKFTKEVTPKLIEALYDENGEVAQAVAHSLGFMRDKSAIPSLIEILYHENLNTRLYAAMALGRMADESSLKPLLELLQRDHDKKVRSTVLVALGHIASPKTLPLILKYGLNDTDPHVRASAVEAISKLNLPREEVLKHLKGMLNDPNNRVFANTCLAIWKVDEIMAMNHINKLIKSPDKWYRASGSYVLGQIGSNEAVNILLSMKNDAEADVRLNVAKSLGNIKSTKAITAIFDLLDDEDEVVKKTAYDAVLNCSDKSVFWQMIQYLKSPHEVIRYLATVVLCNIDDPKASPFVLEEISKEKNAEVKSELVKYLTLLMARHPVESYKDVFSETQKNAAVAEEGLKMISLLHIDKEVRKTLYESAAKSNFQKVSAEAEKILNPPS